MDLSVTEEKQQQQQPEEPEGDEEEEENNLVNDDATTNTEPNNIDAVGESSNGGLESDDDSLFPAAAAQNLDDEEEEEEEEEDSDDEASNNVSSSRFPADFEDSNNSSSHLVSDNNCGSGGGGGDDDTQSKSGTPDLSLSTKRNKRKNFKPRNINFGGENGEADGVGSNSSNNCDNNDDNPLNLSHDDGAMQSILASQRKSLMPRKVTEETTTMPATSSAMDLTTSKQGLFLVKPEVLFGNKEEEDEPAAAAAPMTTAAMSFPPFLSPGFAAAMAAASGNKSAAIPSAEGIAMKNAFQEVLKLYGVPAEIAEAIAKNAQNAQGKQKYDEKHRVLVGFVSREIICDKSPPIRELPLFSRESVEPSFAPSRSMESRRRRPLASSPVAAAAAAETRKLPQFLLNLEILCQSCGAGGGGGGT